MKICLYEMPGVPLGKHNIKDPRLDQADKLVLDITDNGVGIPMTVETRPAAVNKLEDRARVLGGLLQITSSKETGTRIRLLVKRSQLSTRSAQP